MNMNENKDQSNVIDKKDGEHDILVTLKSKEANYAYSLCYKGDNTSLLECYFILGSKDTSIAIKPSTLAGQEVRNCIVSFLFEAVDYFGEDHEIVGVAIDYLDRFLLTRLRHDDENIIPTNITANADKKVKVLDICVLASLGLAIKLFSPSSGCPVRGEERETLTQLSKVPSTTLSHSYGNTFFEPLPGRKTIVYNGRRYESLVQLAGGDNNNEIIQNISKAEESILSALQWYLHPPTSFAFIRNIFRLQSPIDTPSQKIFWNSLQELAYFQAQLALSNPIASRYAQSIIAAAAVTNSVHRHLTSSLTQISNFLDVTALDTIKSLLFKMEKSLEMSYQFDERIITIRGLLTNDLMECWRHNYQIEKRIVFCEKVTETKTITQNKDETIGNRSPKASESSCVKLEHCLFMDYLDSFMQPDPIENDSNNQNETQNSDLVVHYNKHIRPKLYKMSEAVQSSKSQPDGLCNGNSNNEKPPGQYGFVEIGIREN